MTTATTNKLPRIQQPLTSDEVEKLHTAMFGQHGVIAGIAIVQKCLDEAVRADPNDVPFPLVGKEAELWHKAQAEAFRHALEMISVSDDVAQMANR